MSELEFLEHYNKKIQKHGDNPDVLLRSLGKLDQVRVTIDLLAQTGVGKTVSALKKRYGDSEIGTLSRDLVAKWKASVAIEEEERENEESEEAAENGNDDPRLSPEYSVPEYVPTRISTEEARKASSEDENNREKGDNSQDEEKYSKKSKKKKSHRERSEEGESHRSDKSHKHKKDKEREKEKKHKHSEREKEKESRSSSSSRDKEKEQKRKSSHRDRHREDDVKTKEIKKEKKCDIKEESDQGDRNKHRNDDARHGIHDNQRELKHVSKSEVKHSRSKHHDLSSFDMFSKPSLEDNEEKTSSRKRKGNGIEDSSSSKHPKLLGSSHKNNLPSLPSSFSGTNLIPDISPIYKPLPRTNPFLADDKQKTEGKNDIDLSVLLSSKNKGMSRIYSGVKRTGFLGGEVPTLFSQCIQVLKENVDYIEEVGGLPYDIMKPVLLMASDTTLMRIEDCNPHLMEFTGELWDKLVKKHFFNKKPEEMESPREMYERCTRERAAKFEKLKGKMKETVKEEEDSHRQTKLAYVDIAPKAPRSIRNQQAKHGTALPSGTPMVPGAPRPRNQILDPTAGASRAYVAPKKPKTAPLMAKTFKLMRGIKGGFRR